MADRLALDLAGRTGDPIAFGVKRCCLEGDLTPAGSRKRLQAADVLRPHHTRGVPAKYFGLVGRAPEDTVAG